MPTFQLIAPCSSLRRPLLEKCAINGPVALPIIGYRWGAPSLGGLCRDIPPCVLCATQPNPSVSTPLRRAYRQTMSMFKADGPHKERASSTRTAIPRELVRFFALDKLIALDCQKKNYIKWRHCAQVSANVRSSCTRATPGSSCPALHYLGHGSGLRNGHCVTPNMGCWVHASLAGRRAIRRATISRY
jgi:hypothetical protein